MFYREEEFENISETVVLVDYSPGYKLGDFDCGTSDYNEFLTYDAPLYIEQNLCQVKLLLDKKNADIIGYIALSSDSFVLDPDEKAKEGLKIPFNSVPALKIGKLAVSCNHKNQPYGSFLLGLALGYAEKLNAMGVGCRFIVVDADIEHNPRTPEFYKRNGFVYNEKMNHLKNKKQKHAL
ncbi:GNAT family N-acetyltransferase [Phosphitispora sp. TUW77]|uniref:GNAT family N-acetyltransferase n=1 Tax=Phosphitispora sp. TUW77 TaxID=3152361 RepID=UPI003AB5754F